ncbi:rhodanese-like domain-containing protein [Bizionia myxarmorum]|uniref:Rhodanese-like domain-containing protein n=1 Tax=Bizionia myxarmorum TaxID=291186 RepID=A0A5D0R2E3_9FLAO|nr:rhodanese-like domain-containing protein [Bizionia myxarmorum]TYB75730.1 rhodanese-like domain-containing protein [Bizionia myxarmorum]
MADLTQKAWREQLEQDSQAIILDVRTDEEVSEGMIPNAIQMDIYDAPAFMSSIQELDKTKAYYVYCRSGARSAQACSIMNQLGIANTYNLEGGFTDWTGDVVQS